jgi:hypothetical protein
MIKAIIVFSVFIAGYGIVGSMEYQDEKRAEKHYAEMVCKDAWPDYENRNPDCSGIE